MEVGAGWKQDICHFQQGVDHVWFYENVGSVYGSGLIIYLKFETEPMNVFRYPDYWDVGHSWQITV